MSVNRYIYIPYPEKRQVVFFSQICDFQVFQNHGAVAVHFYQDLIMLIHCSQKGQFDVRSPTHLITQRERKNNSIHWGLHGKKHNKTQIPVEAKMLLVSLCNLFKTSQPNYFWTYFQTHWNQFYSFNNTVRHGVSKIF